MDEPGKSEPAVAPEPGGAQISTRVAFNAFVRLANIWGLNRGECARVLHLPEHVISAYEVDPPRELDEERILRISHLVGIYRGLGVIFGETPAAVEWIRRPNRAFGEQSPLDRMETGDLTNLAAVRAYVDREVNPW